MNKGVWSARSGRDLLHANRLPLRDFSGAKGASTVSLRVVATAPMDENLGRQTMKNSVIAAAVACAMSITTSYAQPMQGGVCKEVSKAPDTVGCWIIAHDKIGTLQNAQTYWHIDTYPSEVAAMSAKGPRGSVLQAFGKVWLLTIDDAPKWSARGGEHVADIGPLPIRAGGEYAAQYMQAIFEPGMTAPSHHHSGPEAWYTIAGETCLETPDGKMIGKAGGPPVIVQGGPPMHLTATGTEQRRAMVLILHDASQPATSPAHDWSPKGLCK
jgi:quercetin dioxygenase-like cupin family protein